MAKAILFLVTSFAYASFFVRSSFGDAFVLSSSSPGLCHHRSSEGSIISGGNINANANRNHNGNISGNRNIQTRQEHFRSGITTLAVFSRLGEYGGVPISVSSNRTNDRYKESSAATTSATRGYCPKCKRPGVVCICHALPETPIDCGTRILILQHPREAKKRKRTSTVPLIGLSVRNVEICVGTTFEEGSHLLLDEALAMNEIENDSDNGAEAHALLLYPSDGALPLQTYLKTARNAKRKNTNGSTDQNARSSSSSSILVVVDGTWAQTQSMMQNSRTTLQRLPSVMFDEHTDSLFDALRQEPVEHCTSTLEAVSRAILLLGATTSASKSNSAMASDALERSLKAMVDGQLRFAHDNEVAKPRYHRKKNNDDEITNSNNTLSVVSKRQQGRTRKLVSRKLKADLSLPKAKTKEELELDRIRFVYIAHMG